MNDATMDATGTIRIETTNSTWVFDTERMRFWRVPRGLDVNSPVVARAWQRYYSLDVDVDTGAITVALNDDRTRLLRAWQQPAATTEAPTSEIQSTPRTA